MEIAISSLERFTDGLIWVGFGVKRRPESPSWLGPVGWICCMAPPYDYPIRAWLPNWYMGRTWGRKTDALGGIWPAGKIMCGEILNVPVSAYRGCYDKLSSQLLKGKVVCYFNQPRYRRSSVGILATNRQGRDGITMGNGKESEELKHTYIGCRVIRWLYWVNWLC